MMPADDTRPPTPPAAPHADDPDLDPRVAIRRHTDRCFQAVEETVPEGYIVAGILVPHADVAAVVPLDEGGYPPACRR